MGKFIDNIAFNDSIILFTDIMNVKLFPLMSVVRNDVANTGNKNTVAFRVLPSSLLTQNKYFNEAHVVLNSAFTSEVSQLVISMFHASVIFNIDNTIFYWYQTKKIS